MKDVANRLLKHTKAYYDSPEPAQPRNFTREQLQTLAGYQQTAPGYLALEQQYRPQYGALNLDQQAQSLYGYDDASGVHHPGSLELGRFGTEYQRAGDISDVETYGPRSTAAFLAANPFLRDSLTNLSGRTQDTDILKTLNSQANSALASNGQLSPQEQRALDQQSRAAFASRGNLRGNQSIVSEVLNRDAAVRARQQQAQQFATGVQGMNQGQNDFVGRASQIFGSQLSDPFTAILGRSSGAGGNGGNQQMIGTGATLFNPTNPYANDIYQQNFQAEQQNNVNQANANNAQTTGYLQLAGSVLGALLSDKRIKTNIKKTGEKTEAGDDIYEWSYKTDPKKKVYRGPMAQDVEKRDPSLVFTDPLSNLKLIKNEAIDADFSEKIGKGKSARYLNLLTGELEEKAA